MDEGKACADCGEVKPLDDFGFDPRMASGRKSYCRPCVNARAAADYAANAERIKAVRKRRYEERKALGVPPPPSQRVSRLSRYGITPEQWDELFAAQEGRCAICRTDAPRGRGKSFHVDHDHATGKVRGLLCHSCNVGLGHLGDTPDRLRAVIAYVEAHARG